MHPVFIIKRTDSEYDKPMNTHAQNRPLVTALLAVLLILAMTALACNMQQTPPPPASATPLPQHCRETVGIPLSSTAVPDSAVEFQTTLENFLNRGGDPADLEFALRSWGVIDDETGGHVIADRDFNNDGYYDVLVTLHFPTQTASAQQPGQLILFGCEGPTGRYSIFYSFASAPGSAQRMPQIVTPVVDITTDGLLDLIFLVEECTSLACFREPIIMTWDPRVGDMRTLSDPFESLYTYPDDNGETIRGLPFAGVSLQNTAKDQPHNVIIQEGQITAREAGPHRPATHTWVWHGYQYLHAQPEYAISRYLIHALHDADQAFAIRDFEEAARHYRAVIDEGQPIAEQDLGKVSTDDQQTYLPLIAWGGIFPKEENRLLEEERLKAYARYRLVLTYAAQRNGLAQDVLADLQTDLPWRMDNTPSYYTLLASTFLNKFGETGDNVLTDDALAAACQVVQEVATRQHPTTFEFLGDTEYFGPAVGTYTVVNLCPFYVPPEETEQAAAQE